MARASAGGLGGENYLATTPVDVEVRGFLDGEFDSPPSPPRTHNALPSRYLSLGLDYVVNPEIEYDDVAPDASAMVESMRSYGYTLSTAIAADLIDNSIAAECSSVWVDTHWAVENSWISIRSEPQCSPANPTPPRLAHFIDLVNSFRIISLAAHGECLWIHL